MARFEQAALRSAITPSKSLDGTPTGAATDAGRSKQIGSGAALREATINVVGKPSVGATVSGRRNERALIACCLLMMCLGVALRFSFLDAKVFGNDEATTSVHVSGKTIAQYADKMFDGLPHTGRDILRYQQPDPAHGVRDVVASLATEDPQHPPLYYLLERQSETIFGSTIAARRLLAAVAGCIAVLTAFWLCFELDSLLAGLICGALVAVSPFAIAYSQVAREYSLWLALTFAASALYVRALRRGAVYLWVAYAAVAVMGLYTDPLFLIVVAAHAVGLFIPNARGRRTMIEFGGCLVLIAAAYAPWLSTLAYGYTHGSVTNNVYLSSGLSLGPFILKWIFNLGALFYDADYVYPKTALLAVPGLIGLVVAFVACARRLKAKPELGLIFALAFVAIVVLVGPDVAHHEQRSTASRYLVPLWVACYAALAIGLTMGARSPRAAIRQTVLGLVVLVALTGLGSFMFSVRHDTWWVDGSTAPIGSIARAIERTPQTVVVYHATWGPGSHGTERWDFTPVMLADMVDPSTEFVQYNRDVPLTTMPPGHQSLLLLDPTDEEIATLRERGGKVLEVAGGRVNPVSADIADLRRTVQRERATGPIAANLSPVPSLWKLTER